MQNPRAIRILAGGLSIACAVAIAQENPAARGSNHFGVAAQSHAAASATFTVSEHAVTGPSPFPGSCGDRSGTLYIGAEVEPHIAIDPLNANHLIGAWQQDRYSNGGSRGQAWGVSFDGGLTWTRGTLPLTPCTGGGFARASDPWVAFTPDGTAYQIALAFTGDEGDPTNVSAMLVARSADGGLTWSAPLAIAQSTGTFNDKETITADPFDSRFVYAVWDRLFGETSGATYFSRTTDGGATWEPARELFRPPQGGTTISNLIRVLPDGTLVNMFMQLSGAPRIMVMRSTDRGVTWSTPTTVSLSGALGVTDPDTGNFVRDASIVPQMAAAPDGKLYVVWQDGRYTQQRDAISISRSTDGGVTWSVPVRVNADPGVPAFIPQVHVLADGTIGVTYYDLRSNTADPTTLLTDFWLARSTDGVTWTETRVSAPFDLATAPVAGGYFVGDYTGLTSSGSTFISLYAKTTGDLSNRNDVFAARISPASALEAKRAYESESLPGTEPDEAFRAAVSANAARALQARYSRYLNDQRYTASSPGR